MFITIEGPEGSGKTTNIKFIVDYLLRLNLEVVQTREPGGTLVAEKIRNILLEKTTEKLTDQTELLLLFAARSQHLENIIIPALKVNKIVVCDRFTDASFAYQGGGRQIEFKYIDLLQEFIQQDLRPDLVLLFDVPVKLGLERIKARKALDRIEQEKLDFFERVRQTYLERAKNNPNKYKIIDASQELTKVNNNIIKILEQYFK